MKAVAFLQSVRLLNRQLSLLVSNDVAYWPIATNFSLGPDVSFRGEAEVGGRQSSLPRSIMTRFGLGHSATALDTLTPLDNHWW